MNISMNVELAVKSNFLSKDAELRDKLESEILSLLYLQHRFNVHDIFTDNMQQVP